MALHGIKHHHKVKVEDKHQAIIEAATELFTTQGYENTSIAEVAKKAGVAVGTVYLYFKNKTELLFGVKYNFEKQLVSYIRQIDVQNVPYPDRARLLVDRVFELSYEQTTLVQLMALPPQMTGDVLDLEKGDQIIEALKPFLENGMNAEVYRKIDPQVAAVICYGMVKEALCYCFEVEDGSRLEIYKDVVVDALRQFLLKPEFFS